MFYTRNAKYDPGPDDWKNLLYRNTSKEDLIKSYKGRFVRKCHPSYDTLFNEEVKEHFLLIPKFIDRLGLPDRFIRDRYHLITRARSKLGYFAIENPQGNKSCPKVYHIHLIKI